MKIEATKSPMNHEALPPTDALCYEINCFFQTLCFFHLLLYVVGATQGGGYTFLKF